MVGTRSLTLSMATAALGIALAACGPGTPAATTDDTPTPIATDGATGSGGSMAMCAPNVPDCNDMVIEDGSGSGDERLMSREVTIVAEFVGPVAIVEQAPGSVAEPFAVFLQEAVVDGRMVTVSFSGGEAPCFVVDHVEVDEGDDAVQVRVMVGPADPSADCSGQQTSLQGASFELATDLGARTIIDGSRTAAEGDNV